MRYENDVYCSKGRGFSAKEISVKTKHQHHRRNEVITLSKKRVHKMRALSIEAPCIAVGTPNSGSFTLKGHCPNSIFKTNQDSYLDLPNFISSEEYSFPIHLFGIFDGHGSDGHCVSNFVADKLPTQIKTRLIAGDTFEQALDFSFSKVDADLGNSMVESTKSGTTACLALVTYPPTLPGAPSLGPRIVVASTGDSRAVLITMKNG